MKEITNRLRQDWLERAMRVFPYQGEESIDTDSDVIIYETEWHRAVKATIDAAIRKKLIAQKLYSA